jgi:hypothetical protein
MIFGNMTNFYSVSDISRLRINHLHFWRTPHQCITVHLSEAVEVASPVLSLDDESSIIYIRQHITVLHTVTLMLRHPLIILHLYSLPVSIILHISVTELSLPTDVHYGLHQISLLIVSHDL